MSGRLSEWKAMCCQRDQVGGKEMGVLGWLWADLLEDVSPCSSVSSLDDGQPLRLHFCVEDYNFYDMLFVCSVLSPSPGLHPLWQHPAVAAE